MKDTRTWEDEFDAEYNKKLATAVTIGTGEAYKKYQDSVKALISSLLDQAHKEERERIKEFILPKAQKFIDKVESGMARSKETYADMKDIKQFFDSL